MSRNSASMETGSKVTVFVSGCVLILVLGHQCAGQTYDDVDRLITVITNSSTYKPHIRPVRNQSTVTMFNISIGLYWLDSFDLSNGNVVVAGNVIISWLDEYLTWDPVQYGGLTRVLLQEGVYWKPKVLNVKDERSLTDSDMSTMVVTFFGLVYYITGERYSSTCLTDIYNMPFDSHVCSMNILPAGYDITELVFYNAQIFKDNYIEHQEWHLERLTSNIINYPMSQFVLSSVDFTFTLRRRPAHMLMQTILPYILTVSLNLVACFVSVDSGERVTFSLTLFLSFVFVVSAISDNMPPDSKDVTVFSTLSSILHVLNTFSVAWSVIVTNVANFPESTVIPHLLKTVCLIVKRMSTRRPTTVTPVKTAVDQYEQSEMHSPPGKTMPLEGNTTVVARMVSCDREALWDAGEAAKANVKSKGSAKDTVTWKHVSESLDKLYFLLMLLTYLVSFIAYCSLILLY